ncbi:hypothetical protein JL722_15268 [Aureococcus anophagefferens]|nr:hypothetical protein JL722_15268 [Aureococcus anophagefferens]
MWRPPRRLGALLVVVGLEAHSPTPAPTAGCLYGSSDWYGGSAGEDCTTVCGNVGLTCSTSELVARNDEVDSAAEVEALVASIYGETCASNDGVGNKRRLCVCCVAAPTPRPTVSCQSGTVSFTTLVITTTANAARSVDTADVDGDGDLDPIVASFRDNMVAWYENDGSQSFAERIVATASGASSAVAADVDGDGDVDLASTSVKDDTVAWYENDGSQSFTEKIVLGTASAIDVVAWYENDGSQSFTERVVDASANGPYNSAAMDVDGDGDVDFVTALCAGDEGVWHENDGSQSFATRVFATSQDCLRSVLPYDIDGDGDVDVAVAVENDDTVAWYENDGSQSFTERVLTTTAAGAAWVNAADLDSDGDVDLLSTAITDDTVAWYENGCVANPSPTPRPTAATGASFAERVVSTLADEAYAVRRRPRRLDTANGARSVFPVDVDGDADVDLFSGDYSEDTVAWYENDGSQSFTGASSRRWRTASERFAIDVDGDGDVDALSASERDDTVAWYENDGSESFTERSFTADVVTATADGANAVFATDVDGDGDVDVLSASTDDDTVAWYENQTPSPTPRPTSVFAVDVDGDGDVDVVSGPTPTATSRGGKRRVPVPERVVDSAGVYALTSDADGDGDVDVLAACKECDTGAWYENDGSQSFTKRVFSDADGPVADPSRPPPSVFRARAARLIRTMSMKVARVAPVASPLPASRSLGAPARVRLRRASAEAVEAVALEVQETLRSYASRGDLHSRALDVYEHLDRLEDRDGEAAAAAAGGGKFDKMKVRFIASAAADEARRPRDPPEHDELSRPN